MTLDGSSDGLVVRPLVGDRAYRRRWTGDRRITIAGLVLVLPVLVLATAGSLHWPGRTFPGFFVMRNAVVPTVGLPGWTGIRDGVPFHGRVVTVDERPVIDAAEVYRYVEARNPGAVVSYTIEKDGVLQRRAVPTMTFTLADAALSVGVLVAFGLLATVVSAVVGFLQPASEVTRAFVLQGMVTALFGLTGTFLYHPALWWSSPLHLVLQAAVPAALIHLGLRFPVVHPLVARRSLWRFAPWAATALLAPWMVAEFDRDPPGTQALYLSYHYTTLAIVVLVGLVVAGYFADESPRIRRQRHIVLPGLVLGLAASVYGFVDIARGGGSFPIQLIAPFPAIFYLSVGWAVARHDLFDIDRSLRRVTVYAILTMVVALAYAVVTAGVSALELAVDARLRGAAQVAFFVAVAVLFEPLRARVQGLVDRAFSRGRPAYGAAVQNVASGLTSVLDADDILTLVGRTLEQAFAPSGLRALLWFDEPMRHVVLGAAGVGPEPDDPRWAELRTVVESSSGRVLQLDGLIPTPEAEMQPGATLVVPLSLHGRTVGAFVIGPRRSGQRYRARDAQLIVTLAAQTGIALANARAHHALVESNVALEERVRARTRELEEALEEGQRLQVQVVQQEKMASLGLLVAGVAHEINNPVSFIVGTVPPLQEAVARLDAGWGTDEARRVLAGMREMTDVIADGAARTARIVQDLRLFSRVGEVEPRPLDVREAVEVVLRLTRPRWADRIDIERDFAEVPMVVASPEQISQVLMNLVTNAADAITGRGVIRVATRATGDYVIVSVGDDGAGIAPDVLPRIFDPFFSTKPTGAGTGLGLTISAGIVARHGGRLDVTSAPGRGTEFRLALPIHRGGPGVEH